MRQPPVENFSPFRQMLDGWLWLLDAADRAWDKTFAKWIDKTHQKLQHHDVSETESRFLHGIDTITRSPLPVTSQLLIWTIAGFFLFVLLWSVFSVVDIVSQAPGKSVPSSRIKLIQAPQLAIVDSIHVEEGQAVKKGQLLVKLDRQTLASEQRDAEAKVKQLQARMARLEALIVAAADNSKPVSSALTEQAEGISEKRLMEDGWSRYQSDRNNILNQQDRRQASMKRIETDIDRLKRLIPFSVKRFTRNNRLYKKGGVTLEELDTSREALIDRRASLAVLEQELNEAQTELNQSEFELSSHREQFINEQSIQRVETEQLLAAAQEQLVRTKVQIDQFELRAPVAGVVKDISVATRGGVVQPAETVMQIVPENVPLEVEAKVLNRDIGFVSKGQKVTVKVDTFNFTKYGSINGTIKHLAQDATEDETLGPVYLALVELEQDTLKIGDRVANIVPGMTMTVDIHVGTRRLIEYVLNPILRYQDEVMRER